MPFDWFAFVERAGAIAAVLELGALLWLNIDRNRLLTDLKEERGKVEKMAERVIELATDIRTYLFNERKT